MPNYDDNEFNVMVARRFLKERYNLSLILEEDLPVFLKYVSFGDLDCLGDPDDANYIIEAARYLGVISGSSDKNP